MDVLKMVEILILVWHGSTALNCGVCKTVKINREFTLFVVVGAGLRPAPTTTNPLQQTVTTAPSYNNKHANFRYLMQKTPIII